MFEQWYCPSCRRPLPGGELCLQCSHCGADFGPHAAWGPVQNALGQFTPRPQPLVSTPPSLSSALPRVILRLFIGIPIWVVIFLLALLSGLPYGGGSQGMFAFAAISPFFIALWVLVPFIEALGYMLKQRRPSEQPSEGVEKHDA